MFDLAYYQTLWPRLFSGFWLSLSTIIPAALAGLAIGVVVGTVRGAMFPRFLVAPLNAYVSLFRGTALVVQLFVCYYGLPQLAMWLKPFFAARGLPELWRIFYLSPYAASVLIFALCSGAYHSEYIRGAILSIKKGQFAAARALGFTQAQTFWNIIVPQAARRAWPGCGNEIVYLIKYSSLAYIVTFKELTGTAMTLANSSFRYAETFFAAGLYYLFMTTLAAWIMRRLEKAYAVPGFGRG
ncbi:MAG: amino acid ABC transporter permease [Candidatus Adiutrix sp.]|jgi:polar amino acid transport system permease protein|nr:amino acid ABC transporter permease [Candidatus Adiutrix sp.]